MIEVLGKLPFLKNPYSLNEDHLPHNFWLTSASERLEPWTPSRQNEVLTCETSVADAIIKVQLLAASGLINIVAPCM